jgi:hypothetical protein
MGLVTAAIDTFAAEIGRRAPTRCVFIVDVAIFTLAMDTSAVDIPMVALAIGMFAVDIPVFPMTTGTFIVDATKFTSAIGAFATDRGMFTPGIAIFGTNRGLFGPTTGLVAEDIRLRVVNTGISNAWRSLRWADKAAIRYSSSR